MGAGEQPIEIAHGPEDRVYRLVIADVVTEVALRRGEEGGEPDGVGTERGDVLELLGHAGEIADPVTVAIEKAARVDLVDHRATPPLAITHYGSCPQRPCCTVRD